MNKIFCILFCLLQFFSCSRDFSGKDLVMVSYSSFLEKELSKDPRYLGLRVLADGRKYLLLQSPSLQETEWLAALSHSSTMGCGSVIYRSPSQAQRLLEDSYLEPTLYPPVFPPHVKSPGVEGLLDHVNKDRMIQNITDLVSAGNRFHSEPSGLATTATVKSKFDAISSSFYSEVLEVDHSSYSSEVTQKSLVLRIDGQDSPDEIVVVGAHMDTIFGNKYETDQSQSPGADDDASGIAALLEIYSALASDNATFRRTVEFHAYAAEEIGLYGSGDLAERYAQDGKKVVAMLQFDMVGYSADPASQTIYLVENDTHINLRRFGKEILKTYLGGDYAEGSISGGTSDHASWSYANYPTLFPFEHPINYNHKLHTLDDTLASLNNPTLMTRFAKFGLASLAHLAGLKSVESDFSGSTNVTVGKDAGLFVAITGAAPEYSFVVSGNLNVDSVELCETLETGAQDCGKRIYSLENAGEKNDRRFFSLTTDNLKAEQHYRMVGYDTSDTVVSARDIILK